MDNTNEVYKQIKQNIEILIKGEKFDDANLLIDEYMKIVKDDVEIYSMKAIVTISEGDLNIAEGILKKAINDYGDNFDLCYNLAYVYEHLERFDSAFKYYKKALEYCNDESLKTEINITVSKLENKYGTKLEENKKRIVFFVKQGLDSFLGDIIAGLSDEYETKKIIATDFKQIDEGMKWADICWFEWCDELVAYGSELPIAKDKKIICRLHSYEAFTDYPHKVDWDKVDKLVFVAEHIKKFVANKFKIDNKKVVVVSNGIDINKWTFAERKLGYNIAYVGYINYKKGPMLLLHTFKAIYDKNHRYKLYIAGQFQDDRDVLYFQQMIKEFGIEKNVIYEGWQDDLDTWLEGKNYILCTSILESQNMSVMQAMSKGLKPIVHNFVGARDIYDDKYIWNTINEAVDMISDISYNPNEYRKFIVDKYSLDKQVNKIKSVIENLSIYRSRYR